MPPPPPMLPSAPQPPGRKARLDAAIAHFRSEASASGYVVEEVRLRLPVPEVDVLPRVVIAQNAAASAAAAAAGQTPLKLPRLPPPLPLLGSNGNMNGKSGVKRTVSGSVILNALSPNRSNGTSTLQPPRGKFWTTVIADKDIMNHRSPAPSASPTTDYGRNSGGSGKSDIRRGRTGNTIPDSHVQLLLSSVAEMPARPSVVDTSVSSSASPIATPPPPITVAKAKAKTSNGSRSGSLSGGGRTRPATARPFRCTQCRSSFDREGHLRVHILAVHEKKRPFVCHVCDSAFGHSSSLLRHVRTVHQESSGGTSNPANGDPHFRCSVCSTAFSRVSQLNRHVAAQHNLRSPQQQHSNRSVGTVVGQESTKRTAKFPTSDALVAQMKSKHRADC